MDRSRPFGAWATAWKAKLLARTGFWRALVEMLLVGFAVFLLDSPLGILLGTPWSGALDFLFVGVYVLAAWRLAPGNGSLLHRVARALVWSLLYGWIGATFGFLVVRYLHYPQPYRGVALDEVPYVQYLLAAVLSEVSTFSLIRILLALWSAGQARLRWRLMYSYVLVTLLALFVIIPVQSLYIGIASLFAAPTVVQPEVAAQRAISALTPLLQNRASADQTDAMMQGLLDSSVHLAVPPGQTAETGAAAPSFNGVRRMILLRPDGIVWASAGEDALPAGAPLPPALMVREAALLAQVPGRGCVAGRPAGGTKADTAVCALLDAQGAPMATLLLETHIDSITQFQADFERVFSLVLINTTNALALLFLSMLGILLIAGGSGYFLAQRMTRRIERLAAATGDLAAGNLTRRVDVDSADEIGQLSANFDSMAARLQEREQALTVEKERAERLLGANRRLVADVSHELRTPLATLRGYLEALEQEHGEHLPAHDLAVIQNEMQRLTTLIDDLFTLARAEVKQLPLNLEPVDAVTLVRDLAETLAPLARRERQIELITALPTDLPPVQADRMRLQQVVLNLLQNALRYTLPGGIVAVEGRAENGMVTLAVDDTGVGIPAEELPLVFERFYRSDRSRARESGGAGIGLALVQELVTAMGGSVAVQSTPGRGSRFSIALHCARLG